EKTADWVVATCYDIGIRQGKTCIVVQDGPGFYVNRILAPYINECLLMIEEGAKLEFVDKALKKKGFPVGPIQLLDEVGLDVAAHIMVQGIGKFAGQREGFKIGDGVVKMYEAGYHGKKNAKGFYRYHPKKKKRKGPDSSIYTYFGGAPRVSMDLTEVQNRALMLMLNEAVLCLEDGIISNVSDGDLGAVFGIGFLPFTGGPFRYMDFLGTKKVVEIMKGLEQKFGPKFRPAQTLVDMAAKNARFHPES
ncbi:MAG: 3-hydroxyacyl-CoA dehydrogenase family protein, partial [Bacteroidota bacterium]